MSPLSQKILAAIALILAIGLGAPAGASAQDDDPPPTVAYRQSLMQGFRMHTGALRAIFGDDVAYTSHVALHANTIRDLAMMLSDVFPEGSGGEDSGAMDAVWTNAGDFQERLAGFQSAGEQLAKAAASGDMATTRKPFRPSRAGAADAIQTTANPETETDEGSLDPSAVGRRSTSGRPPRDWLARRPQPGHRQDP